MSDLVHFEYKGQPVRSLTIDGEPWFVAPDACEILGHSRVSNALRALDSEDLGTHLVSNKIGTEVPTQIVSEPGLYVLILRSNRPEAGEFRRWVTREVLPQIRRTGSYSVSATPASRFEIPKTHAEALRMAAEQMERADAAEALAVQQGEELESARPKAEYVDEFVKGDGDLTPLRVLANQLGIQESVLRQHLMDCELIYKKFMGRRWSGTHQREIEEYQYYAYAKKRPAWFKAIDLPKTPRLPDGQMRTALHVTPVGKVGIRNLLKRRPIGQVEAAGQVRDGEGTVTRLPARRNKKGGAA